MKHVIMLRPVHMWEWDRAQAVVYGFSNYRNLDSASVWMIPATHPDDPDHQKTRIAYVANLRNGSTRKEVAAGCKGGVGNGTEHRTAGVEA